MDHAVMEPKRDTSNNPEKSGRNVQLPIQALKFAVPVVGALVALALGLFCCFGFLDSFEPGNGLAPKAVYGALAVGFLVGAIVLGRCVRKESGRPHSMARWTSPGSRNWIWGALALVVVESARCNGGSPDPLLASGEQALIGSYKLDNVLLAPGKLVVLPNCNPLFKDAGDSPEQAAQKGLLNARQLAVLKRQDGTMAILPNHSFVITNLPTEDLTRVFTVKGTWSMKVYHVFDTYAYRISLKCAEYTGAAIHAKFFNADKPNQPILQIFSDTGKKDAVMFRFANTNSRVSE